MKTIYYKVPECCGDQVFEIAVHKSFELNDDVEAWVCAQEAAKDFYKKMDGEWGDDASLKFFLYETESKVYSAYVHLEVEARFCIGTVYRANLGAGV